MVLYDIHHWSHKAWSHRPTVPGFQDHLVLAAALQESPCGHLRHHGMAGTVITGRAEQGPQGAARNEVPGVPSDIPRVHHNYPLVI